MEAKLQQQTPQKAQVNKPNLTGIPTQMKLDFEQRSGLSFDDVRVHYNSDKPAQLQALAYTQGTQVYVGPGQERHLPHELGHVVQQKTKPIPTSFLFNHTPVNTDISLEHEANFIGQSRGKNCITGGSYTNNIIQAQFKISADINTNQYTLIHVGRVNFSDEIKQQRGVSRNHFISNDLIVQAIQRIIESKLNQLIDNEDLEKNLLRLCDAVIPYDQMELKTSDKTIVEERIYDDIKINQDRTHVLAIVARIKGIFTNVPIDIDIDIDSLAAFINELEFYLCNSRENLRYGNSKVNSGIGSSLDIPTNVIYPTAKNTLHTISTTVTPDQLSENGTKYLVKIDLTDIDNHPLAKRLRKFLKLRAYFSQSDFLPKVRDIYDTPYLVSSDMDSKYVEDLSSNTKRGVGDYKSSENITLHLEYIKSYPTDYRKKLFKGKTVQHNLSFSTESYLNTPEIVFETIPERSSIKPKPPKVDDRP